MKEYEVKLGRGAQRWTSPYDYIVPVAKDAGLCGAFTSIDEALDHPIGSPKLEELAKDAKKIAICVPDVTRGWCQAPLMNNAVRKRIALVNKNAQVTWIAATGQHREVLEQDKEMVFGDALMDGDEWISHDCDAAVDATPATRPAIPASSPRRARP